jgi:excisionase family DNA binding protein
MVKAAMSILDEGGGEDMDEVLKPNEVADRLKIHLMTVYRWISSGRLQARRLPGGGLRIDGEEVEKLLSPCRRKTGVKSRQ